MPSPDEERHLTAYRLPIRARARDRSVGLNRVGGDTLDRCQPKGLTDGPRAQRRVMTASGPRLVLRSVAFPTRFRAHKPSGRPADGYGRVSRRRRRNALIGRATGYGQSPQKRQNSTTGARLNSSDEIRTPGEPHTAGTIHCLIGNEIADSLCPAWAARRRPLRPRSWCSRPRSRKCRFSSSWGRLF